MQALETTGRRARSRWPELAIAAAVVGAVIGLIFPAALLVAAPLVVGMVIRRSTSLPVATAAAILGSIGAWLVGLIVGGALPELRIMSPLGCALVLTAPACLAIIASRTDARMLIATARGASRWFSRDRVGSTIAVASGPVIVLLAVGVALERFGTAGFAWTMSGDARNHLLLARQIVRSGGVDQRLFSWYPPLPDAIFALISNPLGRSEMLPAHALASDVRALGFVYVAAVIASSLALVCLAAIVMGRRYSGQSVALAISSLAPLSGLVVGVALRDGFYPAVVTIVVVALSLVMLTAVGRTDDQAERFVALAFGIVAIPVLAACWTAVVAPVAIGLVVVGLPTFIRMRGFHRIGIIGVVAIAGLVAIWVVLPLLRAGTASAYIALPGSIAAPSPEVFVAFAALACVVAMTTSARRGSRRLAAYPVATLVVLALVVYAVSAQPPTMLWGYYPSKLAWIWIAVSLPYFAVATAIVVSHATVTPEFANATRHGFSALARPARLVVVLLAIAFGVLAIRAVSPVPSPYAEVDLLRRDVTSAVAEGWVSPSAASVAKVLEVGNSSEKLVMWNYLDPSNDRLGNFWLAAYDEQPAPRSSWPLGALAMWSYYEVPGQTSSLCDLLKLEPNRVLITSESPAPTTQDLCPFVPSLKSDS
jgi:hypothetical protein